MSQSKYRNEILDRLEELLQCEPFQVVKEVQHSYYTIIENCFYRVTFKDSGSIMFSKFSKNEPLRPRAFLAGEYTPEFEHVIKAIHALPID